MSQFERNGNVWGGGDFIMVLLSCGLWAGLKVLFNRIRNPWRCVTCGATISALSTPVTVLAGGGSLLAAILLFGAVGRACLGSDSRSGANMAGPTPAVSSEPAARPPADINAAEADRAAPKQEPTVSELEAQADAAEKKRQKSIKRHFPEKKNAFMGCIEEKGGAHIRSGFRFASEVSIAYQIELGPALAQRFLAYIDRASSCSAFTESAMERALVPALPHLQNARQLVTLIATAADLAAMGGDNSSRNFAAKVQTLVNLID